ncbi:MAG: aminotransferase class III-fold pyridoxal phosphate-dependent enzyme [Dehalococcoidia bacterium]|nr:aminotransferase class III-fold pyridoxal phosphate-dependent enzyme [Dehalococcoidia bacterium]
MNDTEYRALIERDIAHLIHSQYSLRDQQNAIIFEKGEGAILTDVRGREYIDGLSSLWNVAVGHGRKELAEAAAAQMGSLAFANGYTGYSNLPSIQLAEKLVSLSYSNMDAVFFANSGSEANEVAFKLARFHWHLKGKMEKVKIITRRQAYHGGTLATTAATGLPPFWRGFGPLDPTFIREPTNHPFTPCTAECALAIEEQIIREGPDTVAAIIAEPVQGAGGVIPPGPDYFPTLRQVCDRQGVLLIADEVITGFGRTGRWFALRHWDVQPDIVTFAKAVTSAYVPLSGAIVSREIHQAILDAPLPDGRFMHGMTNSGHPGACAVALRNLQIFDDENLVESAASLGQRLQDGLRGLLSEDGVGDVRGLGLMAGVEIMADVEKRKPFPIELGVGPRVVAACKERGLISRNLADNYLLAPPLVTTPEQIDRIVDIVREAVREVVPWARRQKPEM